MSDAARLHVTVGNRAFRSAGFLWLFIGSCSLVRADFDGKWYFTIVGFVLGTVLVLLLRPVHMRLDARAGVVTVRTPRFPLGGESYAWPLADVEALDLEVVPNAFVLRSGGRTDGYRLVWRFRSGERVPLRPINMTDTPYARVRDRVNAFLVRVRP